MITRLKEHCNFRKLFVLFVLKRNFILINHLFHKTEGFNFDSSLFLACLHNDAYDIAVMLYKDFETSLAHKEIRDAILPHIVTSFSKNTGLLEAKTFLLKRWMDWIKLRDAKQILNQLDYRVSTFSKSHIFIVNLNPVKTACMLIEILSLLSKEFYCLH